MEQQQVPENRFGIEHGLFHIQEPPPDVKCNFHDGGMWGAEQ